MRSWLLPPVAAFLFVALAVMQRPTSAQETTVYIALGDSLAFGVGADTPGEQGYVALTTSAVGVVDLVNVSVPGATSGDILRDGDQVDQALAEIETRGGADIISIDIGANDLIALAANSSCLEAPSSADCQDSLGDTLATLQTNLTQALQLLREAAPDARIFVLDLYNPYSGSGNAQELIAEVGVQQINGVITASARDPSVAVTFVSIHDVFEGRATQWIASDGIHPNNDGHRVLAEGLIAAIEGRDPVLPSDLAPPPSQTPIGQVVVEQHTGVDEVVAGIGAAVAFAAGVALCAAYVAVRGRR